MFCLHLLGKWRGLIHQVDEDELGRELDTQRHCITLMLIYFNTLVLLKTFVYIIIKDVYYCCCFNITSNKT